MNVQIIMTEILVAIRAEIIAAFRSDPDRDCHNWVCSAISNRFQLWDVNECFPTWLSRIVAGEILDYHNSEGAFVHV